jgi:hypothetical protein
MTKKQIEIEKSYSGFEPPEPFTFGEMGVSGARMFGGIPAEELKSELNFPVNLKTYKQMLLHPAVNASISLYKSMLTKAVFRVQPVKNPTAKEKKQAQIIEQMLDDMEIPLEDVVASSLTSLDFGFAPLEKVFRHRTTEEGSMYNDGLVGIKKLALRHQQSITKFIFDDDGNDVLGMKQNLSFVNDPFNRYVNRPTGVVILPREKFLLFTVGHNKTNPYGVSPLRNVYLPWKYLQAIEELEASGVAKDLQGVPLLTLPAAYMSSEATPEQKAALLNFQNILRNLQQNSQAGVMLPSDVDPDTKTKLFDLELMSTIGQKSFDTSKIKEYYRTMIFIGLAADILLMGNTATGSFALGAIKNSLTGTTVEGYLKGIIRVFNEDLIKHLYVLNGWDVTRRCELDYEGFEDTDMETYSKFVQRIGSVGYLPKSLDVINDIMLKLGLDPLPEDTNLDEILPDSTSKSSAGMKTAGEGTSLTPSGSDTSSINSNNAA